MALIECNFYAETLERTVTFNAIIPTDKSLFIADQEQSTGFGAGSDHRPELKTLYLLHGGLGNYSDWLSGTRIHMWAQEKNLAVIMPSGDNRWYIDDEEGSSQFGNYGRFIGEELIDFTRKTFPLSSRREDTFVAGLSMGGYGALVNGLRYPDTFGRIAALSPGLVLGDIIPGYSENDDQNLILALGDDYLRTLERVFGSPDRIVGSNRDYKGLITRLKDAGADIPGIFLTCGESDFIVARSRDYHRFLEREGVDHTYLEGPGGHDWTFWDSSIQTVLDWLPLDADARDGRHSGNVAASPVTTAAS
jgi:putative tributyrin esterase